MNIRMSNMLYIGNLSVLTDRESLTKILKALGEVVKVDVILNDNSRSRRCFAIVEMLNQKEADFVIEKLNGIIFLGRVMRVKRKQTICGQPD